MIADFNALLYAQLEATFGVAGTITPKSGSPASIAVRDATMKTTEGGDVRIVTTQPMARVRMVALTAEGISIASLNGGTVTFNGKTWRIDDAQREEAPHAGAEGEVLLYLGRVYP